MSLLLALTAGGSATYNQYLAVTLDDVTVAIAQTAQHAQNLAVTLDDVTVAFSQTTQHSQSLAVTLDDVTVSVGQSISSGSQQRDGKGWERFKDVKPRKPKRMPEKVFEVIEQVILEEHSAPVAALKMDLQQRDLPYKSEYGKFMKKIIEAIHERDRLIEEEEEVIAMLMLLH